MFWPPAIMPSKSNRQPLVGTKVEWPSGCLWCEEQSSGVAENEPKRENGDRILCDIAASDKFDIAFSLSTVTET
uniref:Uncharacterized protein n=1 Tax=Ascaris lumbricoides TaxID=6252 RepID=A0A0M3I471_ASCLU